MMKLENSDAGLSILYDVAYDMGLYAQRNWAPPGSSENWGFVQMIAHSWDSTMGKGAFRAESKDCQIWLSNAWLDGFETAANIDTIGQRMQEEMAV